MGREGLTISLITHYSFFLNIDFYNNKNYDSPDAVFMMSLCSVYCALYNIQSTLYIVQCAEKTVHYTLYSANCTVYSVQ